MSSFDPPLPAPSRSGRHVGHRASRWSPAVLVAAVSMIGIAPAPASATALPDGGDLPAWGSSTSRVNLGPGSREADQITYCCPVISAHGRYVAFESDATNLVPDDTNGAVDVFVRDRLTDQTTRISVASDGTQANGSSYAPSISYDGQTIVFASDATNLVEADTNELTDVYLHDLRTGRTKRISLTSDGGETNGTNGDPLVSGNGRYVAFISDATNVVPGDDNGLVDVFVRHRSGRETELISVSSQERQGNGINIGPAISRSGRFVAFVSRSDNLVADDTNDEADIFLRDRELGETERITVGPGRRQGEGGGEFDTGFPSTISPDGRFVAFDSNQDNLVKDDTNHNFDAFVRDRQRERTELVSLDASGEQIQDITFISSTSRNAQQVMFFSYSDQVVPGDDNGDADVFVRDRRTNETKIVTVGTDGRVANKANGDGEMSADGQHIVFWSSATNLVRGDTNRVADIFVRDGAGGFR